MISFARGLKVIALVWAAVLPAMAAEEGPFLSLPLEQALKKAGEEQKLVFIDFYTTWCGPCKTLDKTTLKDEKVIAWLSEHTVPLKIDAEKQARIADRYNVEVYPTLLFLKPDGSEVDRLIGALSANEFLEEAQAVLAGKDAITRAKEKLEAGDKNDPMARLEYARVLHRQGLHAEALEEYLWCFDKGLEHGPAFQGVRLSFLLSDIADLGRVYLPAIAALRERRDTAREEILAGQASRVRILEFTSLNERLGSIEDSLALYDQLKQERPESQAVAHLREDLIDELLDQRRYAEIAEGIDLKARIDQRFETVKPSLISKLLMLKQPKEIRDQVDRAQTRMLIRDVARFYQVLIGLERFDEAEELAERLLKFNDDAQTYNALAWNGYLTGNPVEANEAQAREAYAMTAGANADIVDTLARVLHARGKQQEALSLVEKAQGQPASARDQKLLEQCLADIGGQPAANRASYILLAAVPLAAVLALLVRRRTSPAAAEQ